MNGGGLAQPNRLLMLEALNKRVRIITQPTQLAAIYCIFWRKSNYRTMRDEWRALCAPSALNFIFY